VGWGEPLTAEPSSGELAAELYRLRSELRAEHHRHATVVADLVERIGKLAARLDRWTR
jgi:hypothetical protein